MRFYAADEHALRARFGVGEKGLAATDAADRLATYGKNALPEARPTALPVIFLRQFASPLIYVLLAAAAIIYLTEEPVDAYIILAILVFNAIIGTIQEGKAQDTLRALRSFATTSATVLRDGVEILVPDAEIVPGDVLLLSEGGKVPADARIIGSRGLRIDESALTGESEPVEKTSALLADTDLTLGDQVNMAFKGTNVVAGSGHAIVIATGGETALGKIATQIKAVATEIPLQATIRRLSRAIIIVVAVISALIFVLGLSLGYEAAAMFSTVVSLAVSVIPEGLPIVMTLVLASGVWRMSKRHALVKNLQAVEALGQASVIAVDKTGTITKNEMIVEKVYAEGTLFAVSGEGYDPTGSITLDGEVVVPGNHPELLSAGRISAYTASARVVWSEEKKLFSVAGDPTEAALIVLAQKLGFKKEDLERESPPIAELPFTSSLRFHAATHAGMRGGALSVVGAPEHLLARATHIRKEGKTHVLTEKMRDELDTLMRTLSSEGLRVLAYAERVGVGANLSPETVTDLTFLGFIGMKDGLKSEVPAALAKAQAAGIRVVMITGDHVVTAEAVAREAGIFKEGNRVISGTELDSLSDVKLRGALADVAVFARVTPEHKLRIIQAYRANGHTIAMTGDGINDAPSLVAADLGVAMGKIGTEVAKEAADIVLLDDDFGSIVSAVEEGRGIYQNIRRVALYLFSTSAGETLTIIGALVAKLPVPVLPAQIIWLNFVTDGFLDIALAMEPKEKNLLTRPFKKPGKYLLDSSMTLRMTLMASTMAAVTLPLFAFFLASQGIEKALTISLTCLAVMQWYNAWNCRSETRSLFTMNPFSNLYLIGATIIVVLLQIVAVYHPFFQAFLHTVPLSLVEWQLVLVAGLPIIFFEELRKLAVRFEKPRSVNSAFTPLAQH
ncbi:MAG: HAD-IC family P-type ATPase [Patescibacteria group bacterium]